MAQVTINIPGFGNNDGETPIVILGPNGSGKTKLAQRMAQSQKVAAISAQRRTWLEDSLPVQEERHLRTSIQNNLNQWQANSWQPTDEISYVFSKLVQDHMTRLSIKNDDEISSGVSRGPVIDSNLRKIQQLWDKIYPMRKLDINGFFPKVRRLDAQVQAEPYTLKEMSDGERTVLYMAARVLTANEQIILVDEPELHLHSRLAVELWDELEKLVPDCRFVYITHDLNFTLSRRQATVLIARPNNSTELILVDQLPSSVAAEVLGAATLPFYAKRIFFYEGEAGKGFASEFFSAWFDDKETFAIPAGNRDSVCAAVSGLKTVGLVAAEVIGLIDRDFYPDSVLNKVPEGVKVLPAHEIESIICDQDVVKNLARHLGRNADAAWEDFLTKVRGQYRGERLSHVVASRVRARIGDLLNGAFVHAQIGADIASTAANHHVALSTLDIPAKTNVMFDEESQLVSDALKGGGKEMLAILPGKALLSLLAPVLGQKDSSALTSLVISALNRKLLEKDNGLFILGEKLEKAMLSYLDPRRS